MSDVAEPPKLVITNLVSGDEVEAQFNPEQFKETVEAVYTRLSVLGQSGERLHYQNSKNLALELELHFHARSKDQLRALHHARRHILSWAHPRKTPGVSGGGPPDLLVTWPGMLSVEVLMLKAACSHVAFDSQSESMHFVAALQLEEQLDTLVTFDDVAEDRSLRFGVSFSDVE